MSNFLSRIINDYADESNISTECRSSEEMRVAFQAHNRRNPEDRGNSAMISMDANALYPSMEWGDVVMSVEETIRNSDGAQGEDSR